MAFVGGLYGGYKGFQLAKPAVIPYLMNNPKQNGILVTKEFATDAVADMANRLARKTPVNNPELPVNIGLAPAQTSTRYHHSNTPYHQQFEVTLKKPMVQVGEVQTIPGQKNTSTIDNSKMPKIKTINGYYNKATEKDFKFFDDLFNTSTPENFTFEKDRVAAMFRSDWYKNNLKRKYTDITDYQIEHVVNTLIDDVYNTKGFLVPNTKLEDTPAFHAAYIDRLGNPQNIVVVENYHPYTKTKHMAHHELIHASNPNKILPGRINNDDIVMTPKKSIDLTNPKNKELYDYVTSPDELRVRLLRLNQIADVNTFSPQELLRRYRIMMSSESRENIPIDLRQLLIFFDDDQILNAMKKVVAIGAPIAVGAAIENQQNPYKNETRK